jgi:hypothetical protein
VPAGVLRVWVCKGVSLQGGQCRAAHTRVRRPQVRPRGCAHRCSWGQGVQGLRHPQVFWGSRCARGWVCRGWQCRAAYPFLIKTPAVEAEGVCPQVFWGWGCARG